ncbi:MAG: tyrosine-type recombinase/integrase, partial [candidate division NC10 bacterium]
MLPLHWSQAHDTALKDFAAYLRILKRRPKTIEAYTGTTKNFLKEVPKPLEDLIAEDVFGYLLYLNDERELAARTLNQKRSALGVFFPEILGITLPRKVLKYSKQPTVIPESLTLTEIGDFFNATNDLKIRTIFMTMYSAGLRLAETTHLRPEDIDSKAMVIHVRQGKGMKDREVMLSEKLLENLREYWRQYRPKQWIFPGRSQRPICHSKVQRACRETAVKAGIRK